MQPGGQRRRPLAIALPDLRAPARLHRQKWHGVFVALTEQEGAGSKVLLGLLEPPVDRRDHRLAGAEVGIQVFMPPGGVATGALLGILLAIVVSLPQIYGTWRRWYEKRHGLATVPAQDC